MTFMSSPKAASKAKPKSSAKDTGSVTARQAKSVTPAPVASADAELSNRATDLAREIERALADGKPEALSPPALQALMGALCHCYSMQVEAGSTDLPLAGRDGATGTDIMTVASGLLKAGNLAVFELGMWQAWTGR
jgi:hypothetical protein